MPSVSVQRTAAEPVPEPKSLKVPSASVPVLLVSGWSGALALALTYETLTSSLVDWSTSCNTIEKPAPLPQPRWKRGSTIW